MLMQHLRVSLIISCLLLTLPLGGHAAESVISLKQAMQKAVELNQGKIIKTETTEINGHAVYKIRLVNEGRVKDVLIDSKSGKVIRPGKE